MYLYSHWCEQYIFVIFPSNLFIGFICDQVSCLVQVIMCVFVSFIQHVILKCFESLQDLMGKLVVVGRKYSDQYSNVSMCTKTIPQRTEYFINYK